MSNEDLTPKQRAFVHEYLESGNGSDAYAKVYKADKMTRGAIGVEVSRLLANPKISAILKDLRDEVDKEIVITVSEKKKWLKEVVKDAMTEDDSGNGMRDRKAVISVVAELNKMDGDLAPTKTENKHELTLEDTLKQLQL